MLGFTIFFVLLVYLLNKTFIVVPQESAFVIERVGKYRGTLTAGFHFLIPILEKVAYKQTLKEIAIDVPSQACITKDNVSVEVDGILYLRVLDAKDASYGIDNFMIASIQLAQTTLRSEIGKLLLDETFSERELINKNVVQELDRATDPWGLKVTRYEIKNITPPKQILIEMENQMKAEREKRAEITISEGERASRVNRSMGERQEMINISEGESLKLSNEALGKAKEIERLAEATANGIRKIGESILGKGGNEAVNLQITQEYLEVMGKILTQSQTTILPMEIGKIASVFEGLSKATDKLPTIGKGDK